MTKVVFLRAGLPGHDTALTVVIGLIWGHVATSTARNAVSRAIQLGIVNTGTIATYNRLLIGGVAMIEPDSLEELKLLKHHTGNGCGKTLEEYADLGELLE